MLKLEVLADRPLKVYSALQKALSGELAIAPVKSAIEAPGFPAEVEDSIAVVIESSGSTGRPKRVALSAEAIAASAHSSAIALGGQGQWLLALPVSYIAGINVLVRSIVSGTEPVIQEGNFDPRGFLELVDEMGSEPRFTSLVPNQLQRLIDTARATGTADLSRLRSFNRILVGGQSVPSALLAEAGELGISVTRTYGSSETCGGCVYDGVPLPGTLVRLKEGKSGEIELGGPTLANGYLDDPERTADRFHSEAGIRWFRTGDSGRLDDGLLQVLGRMDDVIISGGIKVPLGALEQLVRSLPGFEDAVVIGESSERWGEVPVVFTTRHGLDLAQLRKAVEARLGPEARPERIEILESIPMLDSGKPDRQALRSR
ncbi:MAG: AMP-binding protein [Cryobacterium sp.]|nr:AMP-binding protein [Cryobacterium sp.]